MSNGSKPPFSLKPPARQQSEDRLGALETLEAWTEKREEGGAVVAEPPAKVAAVAPRKAAKATQPSLATTSSTAMPAIPDSTPAPPSLPWASQETGRTQFNYRVDVGLYNKMKFLAGTTMGMDMTKLMNEILEPEVDRRLRERGYDV